MSAPGGVFHKKRWRGVAAVVGVLMAGGFTIYFTAPKEPVYQGKTYSWWLGKYEQNQKNGIWDTDPVGQEALDALRTIGTNAIPTLLGWMEKPDSAVKNKVNSLLEKQPIVAFRFQPALQKWSMAYNGFQVLGNEGMPALPELTQLLESPSHQQQMLAFDSILAISDDKMVLLPVVVQSLRKTNDIGDMAAYYISLRHPELAESLGVSNIFRRMKNFGSNGVAADALPTFK